MGILLAVPTIGAKLAVIDMLCYLGLFGGLRVVERLALAHQQVVGADAGVHIVAVLKFAVAIRCIKRQTLQLVFVLMQHDGVAARLTLVPQTIGVIVPQIHRGEHRLIAVSHYFDELGKLPSIGRNKIVPHVAVKSR